MAVCGHYPNSLVIETNNKRDLGICLGVVGTLRQHLKLHYVFSLAASSGWGCRSICEPTIKQLIERYPPPVDGYLFLIEFLGQILL